ncbi:MAG: YdeI/OmpD-associated family protein [Bacteroidota bacterium]
MALKKPESTAHYISMHPHFEGLLLRIAGLIEETELREEVKWFLPVYTLDGKNVIGLGAFADYVGLWFFQGALLSDQAGVLVNAQEGKTKAMRHWNFRSMEDVDEEMIRIYLTEAIQNQRNGMQVKVDRTPVTYQVPEELQKHLDEDAALLASFHELPPYKQKECAEYISEAKRESTKTNRLAKLLPMIHAGQSPGDKYR